MNSHQENRTAAIFAIAEVLNDWSADHGVFIRDPETLAERIYRLGPTYCPYDCSGCHDPEECPCENCHHPEEQA